MMDFKQIIDNNKEYVKNIIKLITKESNEDIEQEVYIKAWKNSDKYTECGNFKSWICTIAKNLSKDYLKSAKHKVDINSSSDEKTLNKLKDKKENPEQKTINKFRKKRIINAINSLKPKFKEIIIMYEINGLSYDEISKKLDIPIGTVKSRLYNAKQILAEELSDLL